MNLRPTPVFISIATTSFLGQHLLRELTYTTIPDDICAYAMCCSQTGDSVVSIHDSVARERFESMKRMASRNVQISHPFSRLRVITSPRRFGCAGARQMMTQAWRSRGWQTKGAVYVYLDDDITIDHQDWLIRLIAPIVADRADISGAQARNITPDYLTFPAEDLTRCDYVSGGWCAISGAVWDAGCEFDQQFNPNYWEDADLCLSAKQRGFRVMGVDGVGLSHDHSNGDSQQEVVSRGRFAQKWAYSDIEGLRL